LKYGKVLRKNSMNDMLQTIYQEDTNLHWDLGSRQYYDPEDYPASVTDPRNNTTQYVFDDFGRKNQTTSPDTGTTKYEYDEAGNLTKRIDANGTTVNYTYDALNRLTGIDFPGTSEDVAFTYDSTSVTYGKGRLTGRTDPSGSYTFYYDAHGNLTKEEKTVSSVLYTTEFAYNKDNNLTSITYPGGREVTFTLDVTGKVTGVDTTLNSQAKTLASSISYLPFGGITGLTYGNNLSLSHGYDNQYRTSSILIDPILDRTYGYDANGNVTSIDDGEAAGNEALESAGIYAYDQGTNLLAEIWGLDSVVFDYDDNGNTVSANNRTFVYDSSNRLNTVQENSTTIAEYVYNALSQRIKKVTQSGTKIFHYDLRGHLITETTQGGTMIAEYVYVGDRLLAMITKPAETEIVSYFHNDHLGTPQVPTNDSQTIVWKAAYTPFGGAEISIQTVENPFRLPGQYYDQETGLHYNYFRYYDPTTGRYVTPDPIGLAGGINLWPYVGNNPLNYLDPLGLKYAEQYAVYGVMIGSSIAAVLSVPADVATVGGNIVLTPVEIAAGGALGGAIFYAIGHLIDQSPRPMLEGTNEGDDAGFTNEEERRRAIEQARKDSQDRCKSQRERSQARRRLKELQRRPSKRSHGADKK
jgi:RHS repeat-associated protein